jgi:uncharacterized membrane protein YgdD (TMEM256/DUF423 family)
MFWTYLFAIGSLMVALATGLGAFGAHGLKDKLEPSQLVTFETACRYLMYQALGVLAVSLILARLDGMVLKSASIGLIIGALLFSGSLFAMIFLDMKQLGWLTPVGGLFIIVSWITIAGAVLFN